MLCFFVDQWNAPWMHLNFMSSFLAIQFTKQESGQCFSLGRKQVFFKFPIHLSKDPFYDHCWLEVMFFCHWIMSRIACIPSNDQTFWTWIISGLNDIVVSWFLHGTHFPFMGQYHMEKQWQITVMKCSLICGVQGRFCTLYNCRMETACWKMICSFVSVHVWQ